MESRLIASAQGGNAYAFEQLMEAYEKKIYCLCVRMLGNAHDGEDCAQEAMLRIWRKLPQYRGEAAFSTWVYRVTASLCMDTLRKRKDAHSLEQMQENGFDMADDASTPEEEQEKRDMREAIAGALKTVPEGMRSVFLLRDVHGLSEAETAKALGLTKGTVKSRLARARGKMADCLRAQGITGGEGRAV